MSKRMLLTDADLSVTALAQHVDMSERNFARVFTREVGVTPGEFVEQSRVEVARRLLQDTSLDLGTVATTCGFRSLETFRRAFGRQLNVAPSDYRARFRRAS